MRGNQRAHAGRQGSIPARAGEPCHCRGWYRRPRVYPRACGGTNARLVIGTQINGLSPRVRGNHSGPRALGDDRGSIPARAGEPCPAPRWTRPSRVYPRACGGTTYISRDRSESVGLSPRVRGNLDLPQEHPLADGSIPARAGEPASRATRNCRPRVYPRACGGTNARLVIGTQINGLSPRVRGNRRFRKRYDRRLRSIPARAGEP